MAYNGTSDRQEWGAAWVYMHPQRDRLKKIAGGPLQELGEMLCYLITRVRNGDTGPGVIDDNPSLRAFAAIHDEEDAERIASENKRRGIAQARKSAMEKLTPQERAALGLNDLL
jgi:hypothetical protein